MSEDPRPRGLVGAVDGVAVSVVGWLDYGRNGQGPPVWSAVELAVGEDRLELPCVRAGLVALGHMLIAAAKHVRLAVAPQQEAVPPPPG